MAIRRETLVYDGPFAGIVAYAGRPARAAGRGGRAGEGADRQRCHWQLHAYRHAGHAFTDASTKGLGAPGFGYEERLTGGVGRRLRTFSASCLFETGVNQVMHEKACGLYLPQVRLGKQTGQAMMANSGSEKPPASEEPEGSEDAVDVYPLRHLAEIETQFADAAVAEVIGDTLQISFLERARRIGRVEWPHDGSQPSQVALYGTVAEVARLRISSSTANDLAMNLLLELVRNLGVDEAAFDRNIETVRADFRLARKEQNVD